VAGQAATIDEYIATQPQEVQAMLMQIRHRVHDCVPGAVEKISYGIPTMTLGGKNLIHFGAWKTHIAVYPVPAADPALEQEIAPYRSGKGTLRFALAKPVPYDLIGRLAGLLADQRG